MRTTTLHYIFVIILAIATSSPAMAQNPSEEFADGFNALMAQNYELARQKFEKGAKNNDKFCCARLAGMYIYGFGISQDVKTGRYWALKGETLGNALSSVMVGISFLQELGEDNREAHNLALPHFEKAFEFQDRAMETDQSAFEAALLLIAATYFGNENIETGIQWLEKGVSEYPENPKINGLAALYNWIIKDYDKAVKHASLADKKENLDCIFVLGWCQVHGQGGVEENQVAGFIKIRKAAILGDKSFPKTALAECYYNGLGTPKDKTKAKEWFQKAADAGDSEAQEKLNLLF